MKLPRNPHQRSLTILIFTLVVFDLVDTISEVYGPIKTLINGNFDNPSERSLLDIIFYILRTIIDGALSLVFLYMGYKLAMKIRRARSKRQNCNKSHPTSLNGYTSSSCVPPRFSALGKADIYVERTTQAKYKTDSLNDS